jgi:hypothetical protein
MKVALPQDIEWPSAESNECKSGEHWIVLGRGPKTESNDINLRILAASGIVMVAPISPEAYVAPEY